jgi:hypothetical protein
MFLSSLFGIILAFTAVAGNNAAGRVEEPFNKWSMDRAVQMLNNSPWARQETFTRVISGVGSGISGEKEIYNTYYIRFLSARPIREAFARIQQIHHGYDAMPAEERTLFEKAQIPNLNMNVDDWIVVSVSFRSNDPNEESDLRRFFQSETVKTLKNKVFLSTPECSQVQLFAYFPPREETIGAKFVFPREVYGIPVVTKDCGNITLELLDLPGGNSDLRATFAVEPMIINNQLII